MVALILADGDVPTRARLDTAWPGWDDGVDLVIAADGGARHADRLGVAHRPVGRRRRFARRRTASPRWPRPACRSSARRPTRTSRTPSSRSAPPWRAAPTGSSSSARSAVRGSTTPSPTSRCWRVPTLAGRPAVLLDARRADLARPRARTPTARRPTVVLGRGAGRRPSRCCRSAAMSTGVTTDGLVYPLATSRCRSGPARGLSNVVGRRRRERRPSGAACCSSIETPATL